VAGRRASGDEDSGETLDDLLRGRLRLWQPRVGYRVSVDPLLLADFVVRSCRVRARNYCDLGTGVGVVGLALALTLQEGQGLLVELQPRLASFARRNVESNGLGSRLEVLEGDLRELPRSFRGRFDLCVSNPPFRRVGTGDTDAHPERAAANIEILCTLEDLLATAQRILRPRGYLALIHDAARLADLFVALREASLRPEVLRLVHPKEGESATRCLLLARKVSGQGPLKVLGPLVLHREDGLFAEETRRILEGEAWTELGTGTAPRHAGR